MDKKLCEHPFHQERQAHELIDSLPDSATWRMLRTEVELRASIERGLADADAGRLIPVEDLMKEFGFEERGSTEPLRLDIRTTTRSASRKIRN